MQTHIWLEIHSILFLNSNGMRSSTRTFIFPESNKCLLLNNGHVFQFSSDSSVGLLLDTQTYSTGKERKCFRRTHLPIAMRYGNSRAWDLLGRDPLGRYQLGPEVD